jgi:plastocyanin
MQRRAATIYLVFFLVMGASTFSVIAVADAPTMDISGDELAQGDVITVDSRTHTVSALEVEEGSHGSGGSVVGELVWTNESARYTETVTDNSTLSPVQFAFEGQEARYTATLLDGGSVPVNGSLATIDINASAGQFTLSQDGNVTRTVAVNDSLDYRGNTTTVYAIDERQLTLVWGEPYTLTLTDGNGSVRAVQSFDVSARLAADPDIENQTVTRDNGNRYVVYAANGSTQPLSEYLPEPDTATFVEGDSVTYVRNDSTLANVSADGARFEWTAPRQNTIELEEGNNVTLNGVTHVVHFPDHESVVLSPDVDGYFHTRDQQDGFKDRQNGLWGVTILSGVSGMMVVGLAFLPVKD